MIGYYIPVILHVIIGQFIIDIKNLIKLIT